MSRTRKKRKGRGQTGGAARTAAGDTVADAADTSPGNVDVVDEVAGDDAMDEHAAEVAGDDAADLDAAGDDAADLDAADDDAADVDAADDDAADVDAADEVVGEDAVDEAAAEVEDEVEDEVAGDHAGDEAAAEVAGDDAADLDAADEIENAADDSDSFTVEELGGVDDEGSAEPEDSGSYDDDDDDDSGTRGLDRATLKQVVESLLFASDKPLTIKQLIELTRERGPERIQTALDQLAGDYQGRGIVLHDVAGGWQFRTAPECSGWVQQLIAGRPVRLSRAQLETLAIIAYRQPITRPEIDEIRGVDSGGTLKVLLDRHLIRVLGKKEEPGRPLLYGTTKEFLEFFNLNDLRDLPTLREYHELNEDSMRVVERLGVDLKGLPGHSTVEPGTEIPEGAQTDSGGLGELIANDLGSSAPEPDEPDEPDEDATFDADCRFPQADEQLEAAAGEDAGPPPQADARLDKPADMAPDTETPPEEPADMAPDAEIQPEEPADMAPDAGAWPESTDHLLPEAHDEPEQAADLLQDRAGEAAELVADHAADDALPAPDDADLANAEAEPSMPGEPPDDTNEPDREGSEAAS